MISAGLYLERLSQRDLALLGQSPDVYQRLFLSGQEDPLLFASPFLAFSALIARARADLQETTHVPEWLGPRRSVPVLDVEQLRDFMDDVSLTESSALLASKN